MRDSYNLGVEMIAIQPTLGIEVINWVECDRPESIKIFGRYCILEPFDFEKHGQQLFFAFNLQQDGWLYLPYGPCSTFDEFFQCMNKICANSDTLIYTILDAKTKKAIGVCGYLRINPEHGVIEVGHLHYSKLLQKTAAATEAMYLMMKYAFDDLGYRRYEWKCNDLNIPSKKAATRLGFTFEGVFRQSNVFKGYNRDTAWYSIIDSEWPEIKQKLEEWLRPDNFDDQGKQINRLQI